MKHPAGGRNPKRINKRAPVMRRNSAPATEERAPDSLAAPEVLATRRSMIAEAAYYIALRRNFQPGHEVQDWLLAESQIDAALVDKKPPAPRSSRR
jgi:hypothetical protein